MPVSSERQLVLASAANARAAFPGTPPEVKAAARTNLNEAKVRRWVEETLKSAPPHLTPATEAKLRRLLTVEDDQ